MSPTTTVLCLTYVFTFKAPCCWKLTVLILMLLVLQIHRSQWWPQPLPDLHGEVFCKTARFPTRSSGRGWTANDGQLPLPVRYMGKLVANLYFIWLCVASSCGWRRSGLCDCVILVKTCGNDSIFAQRPISVISEEFVACWQMKQIIWLTLLLTLAALHSVGKLWHRWDDLELTDIESDSQAKLKSVWPFYLYFLSCTVAMSIKSHPVCPANNAICSPSPDLDMKPHPLMARME